MECIFRDIKQSLISNNNWWKDEKISDKFLLERKREEFKYITKKSDEKRILSIIGPRRVGKSILIYNLVYFLMMRINCLMF